MASSVSEQAAPALETPVSVALDAAPTVTKYVLIAWRAPGQDEPTLLVRGAKRHAFHADIVEANRARLERGGATIECLGGGRIALTATTARIYGYSQGFPWQAGSLHHLSADLLRAALPGVAVTHDDEGY